MQLTQIHTLTATLELLSGLHIGAGDSGMHIGGMDNPVIKQQNGQPYIPGSSLKGKIRSLLEWRAGVVGRTQGAPLSWTVLDTLEGRQREQGLAILQLFGASGSDQLDLERAMELGPTRLAFWDAAPSPGWLEQSRTQSLPLTEEKSENSINRLTGVALNPRQTERVPAGARFDFRLSVKALQQDGDLLETVLIGLKLLELDGLGGSGSRGYGKLRFTDLALDGEPLEQRFASITPF